MPTLKKIQRGLRATMVELMISIHQPRDQIPAWILKKFVQMDQNIINPRLMMTLVTKPMNITLSHDN